LATCIHTKIVVTDPCDNCYAHAIASAASDRCCISKNLHGADSCNAGDNMMAFNTVYAHVESKGFATQACVPDVSHTGIPEECQTTCTDESKEMIKYVPSYAKIFSNVRRIAQVEEIKDDIVKNGPIVAVLRYFSFDNFKSQQDKYPGSVYISSAHDTTMPYHTVKVIGWGEQMQEVRGSNVLVPYWLCMSTCIHVSGKAFKIVREIEFFKTRTLRMKHKHALDVEQNMSWVVGPFKETREAGH
jgi:hypothetical protein